MESNMRYRGSQRWHSIKPTSVIFGVAFNPVTSKWSSFCDDALKILSEHGSEAEAHAACRCYEAAIWRRLNARLLADLAHRAI
jgi:NAD-dependent oxidoreductase involved in siderophore biosynthesis